MGDDGYIRLGFGIKDFPPHPLCTENLTPDLPGIFIQMSGLTGSKGWKSNF